MRPADTIACIIKDDESLRRIPIQERKSRKVNGRVKGKTDSVNTID